MRSFKYIKVALLAALLLPATILLNAQSATDLRINEFLVEKYRRQFSILQVGTGDSPLTIPFYEKCGFVRSHTVPNFFTDHYDHPIYECGVHLVDMVYLQRPL